MFGFVDETIGDVSISIEYDDMMDCCGIGVAHNFEFDWDMDNDKPNASKRDVYTALYDTIMSEARAEKHGKILFTDSKEHAENHFSLYEFGMYYCKGAKCGTVVPNPFHNGHTHVVCFEVDVK